MMKSLFQETMILFHPNYKIKSTITRACLAKRWVGLFSSRVHVAREKTLHCEPQWQESRIPYPKRATIVDGWDNPARAQ